MSLHAAWVLMVERLRPVILGYAQVMQRPHIDHVYDVRKVMRRLQLVTPGYTGNHCELRQIDGYTWLHSQRTTLSATKFDDSHGDNRLVYKVVMHIVTYGGWTPHCFPPHFSWESQNRKTRITGEAVGPVILDTVCVHVLPCITGGVTTP